jgi:hypothetical protein
MERWLLFLGLMLGWRMLRNPITPILHRSITPLPRDNADTLSLTLAHTLLTDPNGWPGSCFAQPCAGTVDR